MCQCYTPRKSPARRHKAGHRQSNEEFNNTTTSEKKQIVPSSSPPPQILARIAESRQVLPGPSNLYVNLAHDPSSDTPHNHAMRHNVFSPYSHGYDMSYDWDHVHGGDLAPEQHMAQTTPENISNPTPSSALGDSSIPYLTIDSESWFSAGQSFPSTCQCGDGCTCPGCIKHSDDDTTLSSISAFSGCANSGTCSHCLDCTILSLPASVLPDAPLSVLDANQAQSIDEWIQQLSPLSNPATGLPSASLPTNFAMAQAYPPHAWDTTPLPRFSGSSPSHVLGRERI